MSNGLKKILLIITLMIVFSLSTVVYAQPTPAPDKDYTVLAPLPGTTKPCVITSIRTTCKTDLGNYLPGAFNLTVGIAAVLAFIMITFGGVTYAISDSLSGKEDGKKYIENAIWGLLLVIGAYLILFTINPQILNFRLNIPRPDIRPGIPTVRPGIPMTAQEIAESNAVRVRLITGSNDRVDAYANPCERGQASGCVNLNGLPDSAVDGLIRLADTCDCQVAITGGTEDGHNSHGAGAPIVDIRPSEELHTYLGLRSAPREGDEPVFKNIGRHRVGFTYEREGGNASGTSTGNHWHVVIN